MLLERTEIMTRASNLSQSLSLIIITVHIDSSYLEVTVFRVSKYILTLKKVLTLKYDFHSSFVDTKVITATERQLSIKASASLREEACCDCAFIR